MEHENKSLDVREEVGKLIAVACKNVRESIENNGFIPEDVQSVASLISASEKYF